MSNWFEEKAKDYIPLSIKDLRKLKLGDMFRVFWAKDNDLKDIRWEFQLVRVAEITEDYIVDMNGDQWFLDKNAVVSEDVNYADTSRGDAYFYKAELNVHKNPC